LERFLGILIESHAGHFPLWLSPEQIVVCPITSEADDYANQVTELALALDLRVRVDLRNEKINYKVREHSLSKTPVIIAVGKREAEERTVSIRRLGSQAQTVMSLDEALKSLVSEATPPDQKSPAK
jgi:threonyl-tRNA synthetase